jgi:hypothetical protein
LLKGSINRVPSASTIKYGSHGRNCKKGHTERMKCKGEKQRKILSLIFSQQF